MDYLKPIHNLKGIGPKTEVYLNKLQIYNYLDLINFYPKSYEYYLCPSTLNSATIGTTIAIEGIITSVENKYLNSKIITYIRGYSNDNTLFLCILFHMPFLKKTITLHTKKIILGDVSYKGNTYQFTQPKIFSVEKYKELEDSLQPIYALTKGINNQTIKKALKQILETKNFHFSDFLPASILEEESFLPLNKAIREIHFPTNQASLQEAKKRLAFNEFFIYLYKLHQLNNNTIKNPNHSPMIPVSDTSRLIESLPYTLTSDQLDAWKDIENDLSGKYQMNRLLQGDVGSGKTILAILAILMCITNSYQSAFMAPLEILAEQHFETIHKLIQTHHIKNAHPCLLTSSITKSAKLKIYEEIKNGTINIIIGTHALLQESLIFKNLGLVITDEQHRFGVKQRDALTGKGINTNTLVMSATPIPRSLAIVLYGDLKVSKINMLPKGRLPIKNSVIGAKYRSKAHSFIQKQIAEKHQAYIICPMVEYSEEMPHLHSVLEYTKELKKTFPSNISIASIHGKLKPKEKTAIMTAFKKNEIDILVSTTVIEVGINIPNASVMLIENAERFGLATLHQLRGRIGRGKDQSYCMFLCETESKIAINRLQILLHSNDGFQIANEDLKLRGPGNMLGVEQSGSLPFLIGDIYENSNELLKASTIINKLSNHTLSFTEEEKNTINSYIQEIDTIKTYENIL